MNIEYERNGVKKMTQERFKEDLMAVGWRVVGEEKPKNIVEQAPKKKGRPAKNKD